MKSEKIIEQLLLEKKDIFIKFDIINEKIQIDNMNIDFNDYRSESSKIHSLFSLDECSDEKYSVSRATHLDTIYFMTIQMKNNIKTIELKIVEDDALLLQEILERISKLSELSLKVSLHTDYKENDYKKEVSLMTEEELNNEFMKWSSSTGARKINSYSNKMLGIVSDEISKREKSK